MRDDTKTNLRAPTTGDPHYPFYRHLLAGGTVHRSDPLNNVEADLTLADMRNKKAENIQYYGYSDLSIVPLPIKPFDNYEISPCTRTEEPDKPGHYYFEVCEPNEADVWTLYGHIPGEGAMAIGDFATREDAEEVFQRITGISFADTDTVRARLRVMHSCEHLLEAARIAEQLCSLVTRWADAVGDAAFGIMDEIVAIAQNETLPARAVAAATGKEAA